MSNQSKLKKKNLVDLIGNTPLVDLSSINTSRNWDKVQLLGKLEGNNPGGSVKDRAAYYMINEAEKRGILKKGMHIIEPTSGNTGIALAMIASAKNYSLELVMPENSSRERSQTMQAYGAKVTLTPADLSMEGAIDYARAQVKKNASSTIMLDQFSNSDNKLAHYEMTGPEIWRDTKGQITHFVSAMGTTGTIMGVSRFLKEKNKNIQIVGAQPQEGACIPGIRRWPVEYLPKIYEPERVDTIAEVSQEEAVTMALNVAKKVGVFCGISAGGALHVAAELCKTISSGVVVTVICDRGDRYLSTGVFEPT